MAAISVSTAPGVRNNDFKRKKQIVSDDGMQQYKALEMDIIVGKLYARYTGAKVRNWSTKISHDKWVLFFLLKRLAVCGPKCQSKYIFYSNVCKTYICEFHVAIQIKKIIKTYIKSHKIGKCYSYK